MYFCFAGLISKDIQALYLKQWLPLYLHQMHLPKVAAFSHGPEKKKKLEKMQNSWLGMLWLAVHDAMGAHTSHITALTGSTQKGIVFEPSEAQDLV